jgi:hypothetical protein
MPQNHIYPQTDNITWKLYRDQGRRKPSGPAEALLRIAEQKPEVFMELS